MKKILRIITIIVSILFYHNQAQSQVLSTKSKESELTYAPTTGVRGAFLGAVSYPGFKIGVERPYKFTRVDKQKTKKTKTLYKERYLSYSLGMYHHNDYHTNLFTQAEWIGRRQKSKGFYLESSWGLGINRTFVDGASYTVSEDGEVDKVPLSGNWSALASLGGAIGYNANLTKQKSYALYLKHNWLLIFPYNTFVTLRPTVEFGINYNFSGFWQAEPKFKSKEK